MSASSRVGATALMSLFCVAIVILGVASPAATAAAVTTAQQPGVEADADAQFADSAVQQPDIDTTDLNGSGTPSDPYEISNVSELQAMEDDLDANYTLVSDINASNTAQFNNGSGFDPVGGDPFDPFEDNSPFSGSLDGNNRTVTKLTIDRPNESGVGLIGFSHGTVRNITLTSVNITGNEDVGGIIGNQNNEATLADSSASGSVSATGESGSAGGLVGTNRGNLTDSSASGSVTATGEFGAAGGLVGTNSLGGTITDSSASGSVSGSNQVGGLIGNNGGFSAAATITNATASGSVTGKDDVGGLVGRNNGNLTDSSASGSVTATGGFGSAGGLVGSNNGNLTDSSASGSVSAEDNAGGLVGNNGGGIQNATASGSVNGSEDAGGLVGNNGGNITDSSASGSVSATGESGSAGGLVGSNRGTLTDASASGSVNGDRNVGGLVGDNDGTIQTATAFGSVTGTAIDGSVGGVSGRSSGTLRNAAAFGNVTATGEFGSAGGLVGSNSGTLTDAFAVGPVSGNNDVGGLVGFNDSAGTTQQSYFDEQATNQSESAGNATGLTTAEMQGQAATSNLSGFDFENTWTTTSEYPALRALSGADEGSGSGGDGGGGPIQVDVDPSDLPGDGSSSNPYEISNVSELQAMEDDLGANYTLVSDIDASQTAQFNDGAGFDPVGNSGSEFNGSLDGNDHTVTGLTINRSDNSDVGLFGVTGNGAILTDVTVTEIAVTGKNNVGGIVGFNDGTITASSAGGKLSGSNQVGGLVGFNRGTIQRAQTSVDMTALGTGGDDVGGLVGFNIGTIRRAQASGNVTAIGTPGDDVGGVAGSNGGTLRNVTASGNVSGTEEVGGVAGSNDGTVRAATASGSVTGTDVVGGLIGSNTGTITNVTASGNVTGIDEVGGVVGDNTGVITASTGAGNVNGSDGIGGLVGDNDGEGTDDGIILRSTASGEVTGGDKVGGLVGSNLGGEINLSVATGSVIIQSSQTDNSFPRAGGLVGGNFRGGVINQSYAKTVVSGGGNERRIGGLVGENFNQTGSDPSRILNSYASGPVSGSNQGEVGGLVGGNFRASRVVDSYFDTEATGQTTSAGTATGLTTAQMQGQAAKTNLSGFEFGVTWQTQTDPADYPVLIALQQETEPEQQQPTTFEISALDPQDATVNVSEAFDVSATVENTGDLRGEQEIELLTEPEDGTVLTNTTVSLDPGANTIVTFDNVTVDTAGEFNQTVASANDSVSGTLTVEESQQEEPPTATATATVTFDDQTVQNGSTSVTVGSATFDRNGSGSEAFNIVVHQATDDNDDGTIQASEIGTKIGESAELDTGTSTDVPVNISKKVAGNDTVSQLTANQTLVAMLHTTNPSDDDDIVHTAAITRDGTDTPVFDQAEITIKIVATTGPDTDTDTVTVGGQEVPTEFTSETNNGDRTVTADNAVEAINTFIAGEISADVAVDVINAFIAS